MTNDEQAAVKSGAKVVDEREQMAAGYESPADPAVEEREPEAGLPGGPVATELGTMQLSMFEKGAHVRVRVGDPHNGSEMWEGIFESAEEANSALVDADVLREEQITDSTKVVGTGVALEGVTAEQLEEAGLKRHGVSTL